MRQIMLACQDHELKLELEQILEAYYQVSSYVGDTLYDALLLQDQPDLILLEITDSGAAGLRTYDRLMRIPELIGKPIILLMRSKDAELEQKALNAGATDIVSMPFSPQLLLHRISACLELTAFRREKPFVEKIQDAISCSFAELVECRDVTTGGHLKNTTRYFHILLMEAMKDDLYQGQLQMEDTRDLLRSVTLHDIGKIGINDDVLRKESSLDFNEFEYMKTHTNLGKQAFENIIKETGGSRWLYLARDMAYCHHERWDGTGYPNGLKGEEIPLPARMLTVADVYDALTSNRAYKKAFTHEKAMEIIVEGKGSLFDPGLVELLIRVNDQFADILGNKHDIELLEKE